MEADITPPCPFPGDSSQRSSALRERGSPVLRGNGKEVRRLTEGRYHVALAAPTSKERLTVRPTEDELALLRMLARGLTDEVVAQKLGLTGRTLRRRLRSAMDKLDASSRFEAGFKLARSGWLEGGDGPEERSV